jgi:soluble P-type ATPase
MAAENYKAGINIEIPGLRDLRILAVCNDYTGTLSREGKLIKGVRIRLCKLARVVDVHIVTSDTRGTASRELQALTKRSRVTLVDAIPTTVNHAEFKGQYLGKLGVSLATIAVFGNGRNDVKWLQAVKEAAGLSVAVDVGEGCATDAIMNASIFITGITHALDRLLDQQRAVATLRTEGKL